MITTNSSKEDHKLGIGIIAKLNRVQTKVEWALVERSSSNKVQDEAEVVRLALMKAKEKRWRRIQISCENRHLISMIKAGAGADIHTCTLVENIKSLINLFQLCSFCVRKSDNMDHCNSLNLYVVSNFRDEERTFVTP